MKKKLKDLTQKSFIRNVAVVMSGTAGAQMIAVIFTPFITRLYAPEVFGIAGSLLAIVAILTPISALTYPIAIVLPRKDRDALKLTQLSICLALTTTTLITLIFLIFTDYLVEFLSLQKASSYIYLIPLAILLTIVLQIIEQWLIRKKQYQLIAKTIFYKQVIINSSKIAFGFLNPIAIFLILSTVLGYALHIAMLLFGIKSSTPVPTIKLYSTPEEIAKTAIKYKDFPIYRAPQVILNVFSQNLPLLMLTSFFGSATGGYYLLARTLMTLPSMVIGKAVGDVFYQRFNLAAQKRENLTRLLTLPTIALCLLGIVPFALIMIFGPTIFGTIFGNNWAIAGEYARWLSVFAFFGFINRPCVAAIPVLNEQKWLFKYELYSTGVKIMCLWLGISIFKDGLLGIMLFSISGALAYIYLIINVLMKASAYK